MSSGDNRTEYQHLKWPADSSLVGSRGFKVAVEKAKEHNSEVGGVEVRGEIWSEVADILDEWIPDSECDSEEEFLFDLSDYLEDNSNFEIEVQPITPHGRPDLLIDNKIAIELNINLNKGAQDQLVNRCAVYTTDWITWIILIDVLASQIDRLVNDLTGKGLDHVLVWCFNRS